jgi:hypothetical protein
VLGLDLRPSPFTTVTGSITDRALVRRCLDGVAVVLHTATLHKPHIRSQDSGAFIDTNVVGTMTFARGGRAGRGGSFVFTSTTSAFGRAMRSAEGEPAVWVTEELAPLPRNIYGSTKLAAEDLCRLVQQGSKQRRNRRRHCLLLSVRRVRVRTSVRLLFGSSSILVSLLGHVAAPVPRRVRRVDRQCQPCSPTRSSTWSRPPRSCASTTG